MMRTETETANMLAGRMVAEGAIDCSDAEIDRCFGNVIAPEFCIRSARRLRDAGLLQPALAEMAEGAR